MAEKKIKGKLEVFIGKTIKVVTDIENQDEIIDTLSCLEKIKAQLIKFDKLFYAEQSPIITPGVQQQAVVVDVDDPFEKVANMLDNVALVDLQTKKIFSVKDQNAQLLKPNQFKKVTDAICVLLFILETGIGKKDIKYDVFRDIFESQNIKSGSPLTMLMNNIKGAKYIDAKKYKAKTVSLTPKGQEQAIEVLNKLCKV